MNLFTRLGESLHKQALELVLNRNDISIYSF
jgi:hypothetical protein